MTIKSVFVLVLFGLLVSPVAPAASNCDQLWTDSFATKRYETKLRPSLDDGAKADFPIVKLGQELRSFGLTQCEVRVSGLTLEQLALGLLDANAKNFRPDVLAEIRRTGRMKYDTLYYSLLAPGAKSGFPTEAAVVMREVQEAEQQLQAGVNFKDVLARLEAVQKIAPDNQPLQRMVTRVRQAIADLELREKAGADQAFLAELKVNHRKILELDLENALSRIEARQAKLEARMSETEERARKAETSANSAVATANTASNTAAAARSEIRALDERVDRKLDRLQGQVEKLVTQPLEYGIVEQIFGAAWAEVHAENRWTARLILAVLAVIVVALLVFFLRKPSYKLREEMDRLDKLLHDKDNGVIAKVNLAITKAEAANRRTTAVATGDAVQADEGSQGQRPALTVVPEEHDVISQPLAEEDFVWDTSNVSSEELKKLQPGGMAIWGLTHKVTGLRYEIRITRQAEDEPHVVRPDIKRDNNPDLTIGLVAIKRLRRTIVKAIQREVVPPVHGHVQVA